MTKKYFSKRRTVKTDLVLFFLLFVILIYNFITTKDYYMVISLSCLLFVSIFNQIKLRRLNEIPYFELSDNEFSFFNILNGKVVTYPISEINRIDFVPYDSLIIVLLNKKKLRINVKFFDNDDDITEIKNYLNSVS